ncbi:hypothetical protein ACT18_00280 [Mycolicibacter kumamotonensis]|uniref:Uncharacterized protein n=1 Tax=Mycolicibacter kumamotonensis TaxID=354243 RepID=A0A1B8SL07_9MYCO|nr:hypothetical protein ACT18_00280 [Mycolicibacter kumamotonensis]
MNHCPENCTCGKHRSQKGRFQPKCRPDCSCGKHRRTSEHNARIGISVSLTAQAKSSTRVVAREMAE